jgi:hypothetical protein
MASKFKTVKYVCTFSILWLFYFKSQAQSDIERRSWLADSSLGIVISAHQFDSLVVSLLTLFGSDTSEKKIDDYLSLIRVGNTIEFDELSDSSNECKKLLNLYLLKYMRKIAKLTDATLSIGWSYYSKKYDLQIGGVKTKNNCYRIIH